VSLFTFFNDDANGLFLFIEFEPYLLRRKIDGAIFKSLFTEALGKIIQDQQLLSIYPFFFSIISCTSS